MVGFGNTDQWRQVNEGRRRTGSLRASGIQRSGRMGAASADVIRAAVTEHVSEMKMTVKGRKRIQGNFTVASELRIFKQQVWCACLNAYQHITVNDTVIFLCTSVLKMYLFIFLHFRTAKCCLTRIEGQDVCRVKSGSITFGNIKTVSGTTVCPGQTQNGDKSVLNGPLSKKLIIMFSPDEPHGPFRPIGIWSWNQPKTGSPFHS